MVSEAIAAGDVNAINYFVAQKYVEAFGKLASSPQAKTVIIPADMASLVGTVAGVGELVRNIGKGGGSGGSTPPPAPPRKPVPSEAPATTASRPPTVKTSVPKGG
jgi:hypothetical protein